MKLRPIVLGSGSAGQALRQALAMFPEEIGRPIHVSRDQPLPEADGDRSVLVLANPHALHTPRLLEAAERGYRYAICEKPAAVDLRQVEDLDGLPITVWICHGYRMLWGPRALRQAWDDGRFGRVMTVEGRYWQAGMVRDRSLDGRGGQPSRPSASWKDDPRLGGGHDVLLDLGTHWADLMIHLTGAPPARTSVRRWFGNAPRPHRDSHVHLTIEHADQGQGEVLSFGSVSKTVHGAGNHLEIQIIGEDATAGWSFSNPDVISWGRGSNQSTEVRSSKRPPARLAPFHGLGWLEGYAALVEDLVEHVVRGRSRQGPTLEEELVVLRALLGDL